MAIRRIYKLKTPDGAVQTVEAEKSEMPILPDERHLTYGKMSVIQAAAAIAPGSLSSGFAIGLLLEPIYALVAMLFATVGVAMYPWLNSIIYTRYGAEQTYMGKAFFGANGRKVAVGGFFNLLTWGWQCLPVIMIGRITAKLLKVAGCTGLITNSTLWSLLFMCVGLIICYRGIHVISKLSDKFIPVLALMFIFMVIVIMKNYGIHDTLFTTVAGSTTRINYMKAVEAGLGIGLSWGFVMSSAAKSCMKESSSFYANVTGYGFGTLLAMIPGMLAAAVTGMLDPVDGLMEIGGPAFGILFLSILFLCNLFCLPLNPYFQSCTLVAMFPKHITWKRAVLINLVLTPFIIFPAIYDHLGSALSIFGTIGGGIICIWVTDSLMRRFKYDMWMLYHTGEKDPYYYYRGFNLCAWFCIALCFTLSFMIANPLSGSIHIPVIYNLFGQTLPACVTSSVLYVILFKLFIAPKQKRCESY